MKILIFTYTITRRGGGVFDAVRDLFTNEAFKSCGLNIISYRDDMIADDLPSWKGLPMQLFDAGWMLFSKAAKKAMLTSDADLLHMETLWRCPQRWMTAWKRKQTGKPIVCTPHGMLDPWIIKQQGRWKRIIARLFFQKGLDAVSCFHALCKKELEDIRAYGQKQPVAIIPNGIILPVKSKENYPRHDSYRHLLYLGRLHPKKGIDILIEAIGLIRKEAAHLLTDWRVDIVGWGNEKYQRRLEAMVAGFGLIDIVCFHGGLFGEDKQRMYANADGYILPSHGEGLPMTVLEAWSWKVPVIMTPKCNIPEGFEHDAAVKINDNVDSVKNGLVSFLQMTDKERQDMGKRGYDLVCSDFTWDASAQKMVCLYEWLLGNADKPDFVFEIV